MNKIKFEDYSVEVIGAIKAKTTAFLDEAGGEIASSAASKTRRRTGQTAGAFDYNVDESAQKVTIGNPLENAIFEEFGTGEFALMGNGRRGGWVYRDKLTGKWYRTHGKTPTRALHHSFNELKQPLINRAQSIFKDL